MFIFLQSEYKGSGFLLIYRILHSGQACLVIKFRNLMRLTGKIATFLRVLGENRGSCASSSMVCVTLAWSGNSIMFSGNSLPRRHETARVSPCAFQIQLVNHSERTNDWLRVKSSIYVNAPISLQNTTFFLGDLPFVTHPFSVAPTPAFCFFLLSLFIPFKSRRLTEQVRSVP